MKITGIAIIRNAILNDFPVVEAISSILPVVDEMIVSIDKGEDDTDVLIRSIQSDKLKIVYSTWDMSLREGGRVYALETDKVKSHVSADTDWIFYIQADEVIHEKYHSVIRQTAERYKDNKRVEGLLFQYLHFYGTYDYVGDSRKWYTHEVRIIRNDPSISSYKDAQGFRRGEEKLNVVPVAAEVYHYGWVKSPEQMKKKIVNILGFYSNDDSGIEEYKNQGEVFDFNEFESIRLFKQTHPAVMQNRIQQKNWHVELDVNRKKLTVKEQVLRFIEKLTGVRLFAFKNYKIIRP
ncbi:MAG: glycosyltransferase family 2 protein [Chitinophagaceae bacterium]|nr:glycosyltransferase family 2 protein [Chitinophagaceae bacterium]